MHVWFVFLYGSAWVCFHVEDGDWREMFSSASFCLISETVFSEPGSCQHSLHYWPLALVVLLPHFSSIGIIGTCHPNGMCTLMLEADNSDLHVFTASIFFQWATSPCTFTLWEFLKALCLIYLITASASCSVTPLYFMATKSCNLSHCLTHFHLYQHKGSPGYGQTKEKKEHDSSWIFMI